MELVSGSLEPIFQAWRDGKTERFLQNHRLNVEVTNRPDYPCLIIATHPTTWDSIFWRRIPRVYHAVHSEALKKTGIPRVDSWLALGLSRMVPVHTDSRERRQETYQHIASLLDRGNEVVINPTGRTTGSNQTPEEEELNVGGIIRVLQLTKQKTVVPAVVRVTGNIKEDGTVEDGSSIQIIFAKEPLDLKDINLKAETVNDELLRSRIVESWNEL